MKFLLNGKMYNWTHTKTTEFKHSKQEHSVMRNVLMEFYFDTEVMV